MRKRTGKMTIGVAIALLLLLVMPLTGWSFDSGRGSPMKAMKSFARAVVKKDGSGILAAFSKTRPWRFVGYEIGTGRQTNTNMVSYARMARDFRSRKGWYHFFFDEPNGYTFRLNFAKGTVWKRKGNTFYRASRDKSIRHYIKWRQEGRRWVIAEIGDTSP